MCSPRQAVYTHAQVCECVCVCPCVRVWKCVVPAVCVVFCLATFCRCWVVQGAVQYLRLCADIYNIIYMSILHIIIYVDMYI